MIGNVKAGESRDGRRAIVRKRFGIELQLPDPYAVIEMSVHSVATGSALPKPPVCPKDKTGDSSRQKAPSKSGEKPGRRERTNETPSSLFQSAELLENGNGTRRNFADAFKLYLRSAESGLAKAMVKVGEMLEAGKGCDRDNVEAKRWYLQAAAKGNANAHRALGRMFEKGIGGRQNLAEAFQHHLAAANSGDAESMVRVGRMLEKGRGVAVNAWEARSWFEKAAKKRNPDAMHRLGQLDEELAQYDLAISWYAKAARLGHSRASAAQRRLERALP